MEVTVTQIKQLTLSLESNSTSGERLAALEDLQHIVKKQNMVMLVGQYALEAILQFLRQQQATVEEHQEALDLIYRLIKNREAEAAAANASIILSDSSYIELLLDLLEHEDLSVGVMASQIMTEIHSQDGSTLESQIQQCPDGMNKLLLRLPDSSREEVRNQAIVLIQQLTSTNEEMKKTVVFNEGFEILFGIIQSEGGAADAGLVIQDCLQICTNILHDSETCQRLFFGMGMGWTLKLSEFFDPTLLESSILSIKTIGDDSDGESASFSNETSSSLWFDQSTRLSSAILAINAINNSLSTLNRKHQGLIMEGATSVISSSALWIARKGPIELVNAALSLLYRIANENPRLSGQLADFIVKVSPARQGQQIPFGVDIPVLHFGWKVGDKQLISIASLLAERYIYCSGSGCWDSAAASAIKDSLNVDFDVLSILLSGEPDCFANGCLYVLEKVLSTDSSASDLLVQYALAPPPPPALLDGDDFGNPEEEASQPLGTVTCMLNLVVDGGRKILNCNQFSAVTINSFRQDLELAERAANVLTVVFTHGSLLAKEICTALKTNSADIASSNGRMKSGDNEVKLLLPFLMLAAGRTTRMQQGSGYPLLISILRLLSTVVCGCERAAKQVLEDPSNLFVLDLATTASESAGVPPVAQTASCLFLGCCFLALSDLSDDNGNAIDGDGVTGGLIQKRMFIGMIDSRIGLSRFTESLKKALLPSQASTYSQLFVSDGFKAFYIKQFEAIKTGIISFYAGSSSSSLSDSPQQQVIEMQQLRIAELEQALSVAENNAKLTSQQTANSSNGDQAVEITRLKSSVDAKSKEVAARTEAEETLKAELESLKVRFANVEKKFTETSLDNQVLQGTVAELSNKYDISLMKVKQLQIDTEFMTSEYSAAKTEAAAREKSLKMAEYKIADLLQEVDALKLAQASIASSSGGGDDDSRRLEVDSLQALLQQEQEMKFNALYRVQQLTDEVTALKKQLGESLDMESQLQQQFKSQSEELSIELEKKGQEVLFTKREIHEVKQLAAKMATKSESYLMILCDAVLNFEDSFSTAVGGGLFPVLKREYQNSDNLENSITIAAEILNRCVSVFTAAVGECSDLAEGARISDLSGGEGSVERILDCSRKLRQRLTEDVEDYEAELEALELAKEAALKEAQDLRDQIDDLNYKHANIELVNKLSDDDRASLMAMCDSRDSEIVRLKAHIKVLSEQIGTMQLNYEAIVLEKRSSDAAAVQYQTLQSQMVDSNQQKEKEIDLLKQEVSNLTSNLHAAQEYNSSLRIAEKDFSLALEQKVTSHAEEVEVLRSQISSVGEVSKSLEASRDELLNKLKTQESSLTEVINTKDEKVSQLDEDIRILEQALAISKEHSAILETQYTETLAQCNKLEAELLIREQQMSSDRDATLSTLQQEIYLLKSDKQELERHLQVERNALSEAQQNFEKVLAERDQKAQTQLDKVRANHSSEIFLLSEQSRGSMNEIKTLQDSITALEQQMEAIKISENEKLVNLTAQLDASYGEKLSVAVENIQKLEKDLSDLREKSNNELSYAEEMSAAKEQVTQLVTALAERDQQAQTQLVNLQANHTSEITLLSEQLSNSKDEIKSLQDSITALEQQMEASQISENEKLVNLTAQLDASHGEKLTAEMLAAESIQKLEKDLSDLREKSNNELSYAEEMSAAKEQVMQLTTELKDAEEVRRSLEGEVTRLEGELRNEASSRAEGIEKAANDRIQLQSQLSLLQDELTAAKVKESALEKSLQTIEVEYVDIKAGLEKDKQELRNKIVSLENKLLQSDRLRIQLEKDIEQLTLRDSEDINKMSAELLDLNQKLASATDLQQKLQDAMNERTQLQERLQEREVAHAALVDVKEAEHQVAIAGVIGEKDKEIQDLTLSVMQLQVAVDGERRNSQSLSESYDAQKQQLSELAKALSDEKQNNEQLELKKEELLSQCNALLSEVAAKDELLTDQTTQLKSLTESLAKSEEDLKALQTQIETKKGKDLNGSKLSQSGLNKENTPDVDAFKVRDNELKRLTMTADRLARELSIKEEALNSAVAMLKRREGEAAGVMSALEGLRADLTELRGENELLSKKGAADTKKVKELLLEVEALKSAARVDSEEKAVLLDELQKERSKVVPPTSAIKPARTTARAPSSTEEKEKPIKTPDGTKWKTAQSAVAVSISPGAREAAKLNSEIIKERKRLHSLQEQHSDLLGLLAQQEVELSVFKAALGDKLGSEVVETIEQEAEKSVIDMYGSYTNFRKYALENNVNNFGSTV